MSFVLKCKKSRKIACTHPSFSKPMTHNPSEWLHLQSDLKNTADSDVVSLHDVTELHTEWI